MNFGILTITAWPFWVLNGVIGGLALLLLCEIVAARRPSTLKSVPSASSAWIRPQLAVLIPAHNEAADIARTIQTLLPQLGAEDRLIVIADNCQDATAETARQAGALVLEREDALLRGKGYALDFGLKFLAQNPPSIVVIIDADCDVASGSLDALTQQVQRSQRPVQATYLINPPPYQTLRDQISSFAFTLKNLGRPLGLKALGWPCLLMGSGMAFPWKLLQGVDLAGNKTVDDMQLTIDFALQNASPLYVPEARVMGRLMQGSSAVSQRSRWEHGHIEVILTQVPKLLWAALVQRRWDLLVLGLDLSIPPLSLLILLWLVLVSVQVVACRFEALGLSVLLAALGDGGLIGLSLLVGWLKFGQAVLPLRAWTGLPQYFLWKIPIYIKFLTQPQTRWIKTERDAAEHLDLEPEPEPSQCGSSWKPD